MEFTGFPLAGLDFYEDLEADNSKTFWNAHKRIWEESVRDPMRALAAELEPDFGPAKIFRPYRDVRFSKDKSPYKNHQGAVVHTAESCGWYVQIGAGGLFVAGGLYTASPAQRAALRTAIDDAVRGAELERLLDQVNAAGYTIGGDKLKTKPKGFTADHPRIDLLRHQSLVATRDFGAPAWLTTAKAAGQVRTAWEDLRPLVEWLAAVTAQR
ncbi:MULTISPECIES: DUF2461 domain-containing protein [Nocardia]|uniref:DUF2461 domain-containing protein n=1 Tax=Nocardia otitidiscaviarum TaxID=1823 RepID=A0A516NFK3_9NOCA|nr:MULTISPECIES: DUF2461 domain-containing protein [Nocardia]MCP9622994.1 DUF2461 domain-containing protein [Nocardia otitidiscaviarum]QDP77675.1 DUF2461 domain-containing protein [Nocardia otitidiscaviarum]